MKNVLFLLIFLSVTGGRITPVIKSKEFYGKNGIFDKANHLDKKLTQKADVPPQWLPQYVVQGVIELPYAEIEEPFTAWYDVKGARSRIDYYGTNVQTYQLTQAKTGNVTGISYKLAWMSRQEKKVQNTTRTCFQINSTADAAVKVQAALPNITDFKKSAPVRLDGQTVDTWTLVQNIGSKVNTYKMYIKMDEQDKTMAIPVKYTMIGYDSLFGSHYDRYYVTYSDYAALNVTEDVFTPDAKIKCDGFPGPGKEHRILSNPMSEYINQDITHVDEMFDEFKQTHGRSYDGVAHEKRKTVFHQNIRFIHSTNRQALMYSVAVNHLADRTDDEIKALRGKQKSKGKNNGQAYNISDASGVNVPDDFDWRLYGAVTPVKDQAVCGSCWSFGTVGTIEGAHFLKTGRLVRLSEQELVDCSWGQGNNGCDGGEDYRAYEWIMNNGGISTDGSYGAYMGQDGVCHSANSSKIGAKITGYVNVTAYDPQAFKTALVQNGPLSVAINAAVKSFSFYASGVYYDAACKGSPDDLDHAVLAVGYGTILGQPYWLIKNSWSTYWGNDGYVLISQRDNNCGVTTDPTFTKM